MSVSTSTASQPSAKIQRPLLRYHGSKWRIAPWIISYFPDHRIYVEPFGGGGSVLLRKQRSYGEVYNDLDREMVNLFKVVRDRGDELLRKVQLTPFSRDEFFQSYYKSSDPIEQARRTLVRCGMGFGSSAIQTEETTGFRGSATRKGTHPGIDWIKQNANIPKIINRLQGVIIENKDAFELIKYHDSPNTLFYVDPPYVHSSRKLIAGKKSVYRHEMTDEDHIRLAEILNSVSGMVLLSGYHTELYRDLYSTWFRTERTTRAELSKIRTEVLWMRNLRPRQTELFQNES